MLNSIVSNWTLLRFIRLVLGIFIMIQSYQVANYWFIVPGVLFAIMALFNMGCGSNGCKK